MYVQWWKNNFDILDITCPRICNMSVDLVIKGSANQMKIIYLSCFDTGMLFAYTAFVGRQMILQ